MNELFKLKIFTDVQCLIDWEQNDITVSGNQNHQPFEICIQNQSSNECGGVESTIFPSEM